MFVKTIYKVGRPNTEKTPNMGFIPVDPAFSRRVDCFINVADFPSRVCALRKTI